MNETVELDERWGYGTSLITRWVASAPVPRRITVRYVSLSSPLLGRHTEMYSFEAMLLVFVGPVDYKVFKPQTRRRLSSQSEHATSLAPKAKSITERQSLLF